MATTQLELAAVLATRDVPRDRERASGLLDACLANCDELDVPALVARAQAVRDRLAAREQSETGTLNANTVDGRRRG